MKYAAYLERLDPVQRLAEVTGSIKTLKRVAANKKTEEQVLTVQVEIELV
jgi:hypothetical protein